MPEYQDDVTPDYQAKLEALVSISTTQSTRHCIQSVSWVSSPNEISDCSFLIEQTAKATEQEEESKRKIIALDKEIKKVQEQKVISSTPIHLEAQTILVSFK